MKIMTNIKSIIVLLVVVVLSACGSGGGGGSDSSSRSVDGGDTSSSTTLTGVVADGYLQNAHVFLDRNGNRVYDNGEPSAYSTAGGQFSLSVNAGEGDLYPVVVEVIAGQTIDEDDGSVVTVSYLLEAPAGRWEFISPLTTLVKQEREKNPVYTEQQAVLSVKEQLGIDSSVSVFSDYLDVAGLSADVVAELQLTHKAARTVAHMLGSLRSSVIQNLGGTVADAEQPLVAFMIGDQILAQAAAVKQALDLERNGGAVADVAVMVTSLSEGINPDNLDAEQLALYQQRIVQGLDLWDMSPPEVLTQLPSDGANSPVDVLISVAFNEDIDETMLTMDLVSLTGPNGVVSGQLSYDADGKILSFVPDQLLLPFSQYQVTVNEIVSDSLGNPMNEDVIWTFTTIFDMTPPDLPEM